jgi:hypothetical protein
VIKLALGLAFAAFLASPAHAAEAAEAAPAPAVKDSGFEFGVRLSALSVFNARPLAYRPFELGWRFGNGLRVRTGIEIFYYEGRDRDDKQPALGEELYSYEMQCIRSSVDYVVPLPFKLRPVLGLSLDLVSGSRWRADPSLANSPRIAARNLLAPGALLGVDYRGGPHWSLDLHGRFSHGFTETGPLAGADLGWHYLF